MFKIMPLLQPLMLWRFLLVMDLKLFWSIHFSKTTQKKLSFDALFPCPPHKRQPQVFRTGVSRLF